MKKIAFIVSNEGFLFEKTIIAQNLGIINCDVKLLLTNNPNANCIKKSQKYNIDYKVIPTEKRDIIDYTHDYIDHLIRYNIDIVILTFNRLFSKEIIDHYKNRILNVHLSLLPSFKGKKPINQAIDYGVKFLGATIHFIDEGIDSGPIISQMIFPFNQNWGETDIFNEYGRRLPKFLINTLDYIINDDYEVVGRRVILKGANYNSFEYSPEIKSKFLEYL